MVQATRSIGATAVGSLLGAVILLALITATNAGVKAYTDYHAKEPEFFLGQSVAITRGFYRSHEAKIVYWDRWSDTYTIELQDGKTRLQVDEMPPQFMNAPTIQP